MILSCQFLFAMRQVSPQKYDLLYWDKFPFDFNRKLKLEDFGDVQNKMSRLLSLRETDTVIDLGCGAGYLSFCLLLKYNCQVIGIDYSQDAIKLCQKNKKKFTANNKINPKKITFLNKTILELPAFKDIKAVYLKDVIEHLYDEEMNKMFDKLKKWSKKGLYLVIHTDNNLYLKYVRPLVHLIGLLLYKTTPEEINRVKKWEDERHVNLMTVNQLKRKLIKHGFITEKVEYSTIKYEKIKEQLSRVGRIELIVQIIYFLTKPLSFLRPSFCLLARYERN